MDAENPSQPPSHEDLKLLAESLKQLRDAMVEFSLYMKDCQFAMDSEELQSVVAQTHQMINRAKSIDRPGAA